MQKEIDSEENVETVENVSNYTDSNTDLPESEQKNVEETPAVKAEEDNAEKESVATQEESTPTDNSDSDSKSITMEFCIPAPPVAEADPAGEEAEDFDGIWTAMRIMTYPMIRRIALS